jgi:CAAX prenyl protease-like protein
VVKWGFTLGIAVLVLILWIAPQELLGFPPRTEGFDPEIFSGNQALFLTMVGVRFVRLVIVVPLLEEIFWRGFLLRDLVQPRFTEVPLGTFTWRSFFIVAGAFGLAHWGKETWPPGPDFIPALITGALYNLVAYRTKSLTSCVIAHAMTNLLLGIYIMRTGQWGFW